jgi:hypothetical protein
MSAQERRLWAIPRGNIGGNKMPFVTLNGITIPTAKGGQMEVQEIGNRQRALDGTYIRDTRAFKRRWKFTTTPVAELRSLSLMRTIQGRGFYCPLDADWYATNGFASSGTVIQRTAVAADGTAVYDENGVLESKFGTNSICVEATATTPNKVTSGHATGSTTVGSGGIGAPVATLSVDTAQKWQGTNSIKVVSTVAGGGIDCSGFTGPFAASTTYTLSAYFYSATALSLVFVLYDNTTPANFTSTGVTLPAGAWRRIAVSRASTGASIDWHLQAYTASGAGTFWMDGMQLEASAWPTSWLAVGSSRTVGNLVFTTNDHVSGEGLTANLWMTKPYSTGAQTTYWSSGSGTANYHVLASPASTPTTVYVDTAVTGSANNRISATGLTFTSWHMVTYVVRFNAETNEATKSLYIDGTLRASTSLANSLLSTAMSSWAIGGTATPSYNRLADVQVLPFAVDSTWVTGTYNAGSVPGSTPLLKASGDFIAESSVTVMGQVDRVNTVGYYDSTNSVWRANGRTIEFTLEEI